MPKKQKKEVKKPAKSKKKKAAKPKPSPPKSPKIEIKKIDLEKAIGQAEDEADNIQFRSFIPESSSTGSSVPVLQRVQQAPQAAPDLEQDISQSTAKPSTDDEQAIKYDSGAIDYAELAAGEELMRYEKSYSGPPVLIRNEAEKEVRDQAPRQQFLDPLKGRGIHGSDMEPEKLQRAEVDTKKRLPFEDAKEKYKRVADL